jgi:archaellum component FlaF (FlaF/FlaG flagellin family)
MVKYIVSITKTSNGSNKFYATELSVLLDGTNINISQYGVIDNDGEVGTISVTKDGDYAKLIVTPISGITPVTVRFGRMGLKA